MREVSLGARPREEREMIAPGAEHYQAITMIDAFAFKRMLDRVFWYPEPEVLCFEVRAMPTHTGSVYDVVALISEGGEPWFAADAIPERWDYVAFSEIGWGLAKWQRERLIGEGRVSADEPSMVGAGVMPDFSALQDPAEKARYREAVIKRVRMHRLAQKGGAPC